MSHHWPDPKHAKLSDELAALFPPTDKSRAIADQIAAIKAEFPHGQLDPADRGKFRYNVTANPTAQIVCVDFGAPVSAIGLTLAETEQLIEALTEAAFKLRGIT